MAFQPLPALSLLNMEPDSDLKSVEHRLIDLASWVSGTDSIDPQSRQALQKATQKLSLALETPGDTFQRIAFLVKLSSFAVMCLLSRYL